nr:MAG TPA: hypothetical protein [Caudoviricetes sp.]
MRGISSHLLFFSLQKNRGENKKNTGSTMTPQDSYPK